MTSSTTFTPDAVASAITGWLADDRDVIPLIPGRNLLIKHPDHVRDVLTDRTYSKDTGPNRFFATHIADGILTAPAYRHRHERGVLTAAVRGHDRLTHVTTLATSAVAEHLADLARRGEPVDLTTQMSQLTLTIMAHTMMGWTAIDDLTTALAHAMTVLDHSAAMLPPLAVLAPVRDQVFRVVDQLIDSQPTGDRGPVLAALFTAGFDRAAITDQVVTLLLAGHETTAQTLTWTWIELMRHPDVYHRWQQQITDRPHYARALTSPITREGLRLWPSSWVVGRKATEDRHLGGISVPAGSTVTISPFLTHRHRQFWPDPERFDPDRHHEPLPHRYAWIPFGAGTRMCLGAAWALWEADMILSMLGSRFRFRCPDIDTAAPRFRYTLAAPSILADIRPLP